MHHGSTTLHDLIANLTSAKSGVNLIARFSSLPLLHRATSSLLLIRLLTVNTASALQQPDKLGFTMFEAASDSDAVPKQKPSENKPATHEQQRSYWSRVSTKLTAPPLWPTAYRCGGGTSLFRGDKAPTPKTGEHGKLPLGFVQTFVQQERFPTSVTLVVVDTVWCCSQHTAVHILVYLVIIPSARSASGYGTE